MSSPKKRNHNHKRTKSTLNIPPPSPTATPTTPIRNLSCNPNPDYLPQPHDYFTHNHHYDHDHNHNTPDSTSPHPTPIHISISPTKAAASARLHHDLTTLTTWLESLFKFHPKPPSTSTPTPTPLPPHLLKWRDEVLSSTSASASPYPGTLAPSNAILEALQTLKQLNLSADHLRTLLHEAALEDASYLADLQALSQRQRDDGVHSRTLLDAVHAGLDVDGRRALASMSSSAETLGLQSLFQFQPSASASAAAPAANRNGNGRDTEDLHNLFARRVLEQGHRKLVVQEQRQELELLQRVMNGRMAQDTKNGLGTTMGGSSMNDEEAEHIRAQTAQFNRDTKQINLKIMEYVDRAKSLERQLAGLRNSSINLHEVLEARQRVEERKASVAALQQRVAAFHGLPPDLDASREEVRRAMNELETVRRKRGGLFEKIGNG